MPSGVVHVHFFIMPLYMPTECIYFTYGQRLCYAIPSSPQLYKTASEEEVATWSNDTYQILKKTVLPFFDKIDSPKKLSRFLSRPRIVPHKFIFCERLHIRILKMYTYAYRRKQIAAFFSLLGCQFTSSRVEYEIPFKDGKFCAPAMSEECFESDVLKKRRKK